ncbi:hypothetical protein [Bacillus zhangzhouensis]|uniref:hypothetical protein n=1 Tax=Bacillus zhangzhouensis TaxID=1178540 RepID=UPI003D19FF6D
MSKSYFQDKIGSDNHSFGGDFLKIRLLTPGDAREYGLEIRSTLVKPSGLCYEEEKIDRKNKYTARFASAQLCGHLAPFIKVSW